jgi:hypothetical protein
VLFGPGIAGFAFSPYAKWELRDYGVSEIPATFLLAPDGKVIATGIRGDRIKGTVTKALAGAGPASY